MSTPYTRIAQRLIAPNDTNGNPRRLWVIYLFAENARRDAFLVPRYIIEEGYSGEPDLCGAVRLTDVRVTPAEYNSWVREAKRSGNYISRA
jgi:hypothetical protein